jgi:hypothetical protein
MATVDDQIQLAEQIASKLPEVSRNEWMRWMQMAERQGLDCAVAYAERLGADPTLRPAVQRDNKLIAQAIRSNLSALKRLPENSQKKTFGYVGWLLRIRTVRGSLRG